MNSTCHFAEFNEDSNEGIGSGSLRLNDVSSNDDNDPISEDGKRYRRFTYITSNSQVTRCFKRLEIYFVSEFLS